MCACRSARAGGLVIKPLLQNAKLWAAGGEQMDRLATMRSFVEVVQEQSFAAAARSLGLSRALVSRHIADLEKQVGLRLIVRTTRTVNLTEAGHRYFAFSKRILTDIETENSEILGMREKAEGALAVVSPKWIGSLDLGDAVANFAIRHPAIRVKLELGGLSERTYDFLRNGYDIAFYTKYLRDSSIKVKKIATLEFVLCASPEYVARRGEIKDLMGLTEHNCLVHTNDPIWHIVEDGKEQHFKPHNVVFSSNTYMVLVKAAIQGMGVSLVPLRSIVNEVHSGKLKLLLADWPAPDRPLYAAYAPGKHTVRKVRLFVDFIADWFREHPMLPSRRSDMS
jgi:DNA-binding transcriptional LysR family regulator